MDKPITLQVEDFKKNIVDLINDSHLPPFILDFILKDLYNEIHMANQNQLTKDKSEYEKSLQEESVE